MTTTDWRTLAPGRELDAIVAERVCGRYPVQWEADVPFVPDDAENHSPSAYDDWTELPHYSTDIAAAWLVIAEMERRGLSVSLRCEKPGGPWSCSLWDARAYRVAADEIHVGPAPHAIVQAALAALDSETRASTAEEG